MFLAFGSPPTTRFELKEKWTATHGSGLSSPFSFQSVWWVGPGTNFWLARNRDKKEKCQPKVIVPGVKETAVVRLGKKEIKNKEPQASHGLTHSPKDSVPVPHLSSIFFQRIWPWGTKIWTLSVSVSVSFTLGPISLFSFSGLFFPTTSYQRKDEWKLKIGPS